MSRFELLVLQYLQLLNRGMGIHLIATGTTNKSDHQAEIVDLISGWQKSLDVINKQLLDLIKAETERIDDLPPH